MKFFKNIIIILFLSGFAINAIAQTSDFENKKKILKKTPAQKEKIPFSSVFENKKERTEFTPPKIVNYKKKETQNFLLETLPEDRDIIGKIWKNGKDVTHQKLQTAMSLGTVNTTSKKVTVECRDHSYVDGDRVRVFVNDQPVEGSVGLRGSFYTINIQLKEGYNRIDFMALNQGLSGPNTAEFRLYDQQGKLLSSKQWGLLTGETATLGVVKIETK